MRISLLEIKNFRGVKTGKIQFRDHTVLIGPNNSCKTTIIEALAFVLGRDRLIRSLTEHDFFESSPEPTTRIVITATVTGFEPPDFTQHPDWFGDRRAVPVWFDPDSGTVLPEQTETRQLLACQIAFAARFNADTLEVDIARYFNDGDDKDVFEEENFISVPPKLIREVGFFLIPASRSWDRMLSFSSELFRRVIRTTDGLPAKTVLDERDRLRGPDRKLEDDERLAPVVNAVNGEIATLLGNTTPLCLRVTATDSASVLEAITLVQRLRSPDRPAHGLKGDGVAYEIVANALSESGPCRARTRALLHAVSNACTGAQARGFAAQQRGQGQIPRLVFAPWA
jgi:putative ATP-dependent endonuclease of the OLD family